jgi:hypothetical protein
VFSPAALLKAFVFVVGDEEEGCAFARREDGREEKDA